MVLCNIAEATGKSLEEVENISIEHYYMWVEFFKTNPPIREMLNYSQAHISTTIAASVPRGRGSRVPKFADFMFDFEKAIMSEQEKLDNDIRKFFGK